MNKELKKKWLDALRGGGYKQTRNALRDTDGFCCLGVLCDILEKGKWGDGEYPDYKLDATSFLASGASGKKILCTMLGMAEAEGIEQHIGNRLTNMNDGEGGPCYSFVEIADYIEAKIPENA